MRQKSELREGQQNIITALYNFDEKICVLRPGGGKTISALTAFAELQRDGVCRHALITAPKRVARIVWPDELNEWQHVRHLRHVVLSEGPAERVARLASAPGRDLTIVGHDIIEWLLAQLESLPDDHPLFDLLIIDEISRFRNQKGERYKILKDHVHRWKMIWGLSGTLRPSSTLDLFCPVRLVTRAKLWGKSFYAWQKERFYPLDYERRVWEAKPGFEEIINAEIAPLVVTAELPKMQEPLIVFDRVQLPDEAREQYSKMERKLFSVIGQNENGEDEKVIADSRAMAIGKLGQLANGFLYDGDFVHRLHEAKREWLTDLIENASDPTLLIYEYQEDFQMLCEVLGKTPPYLGAGISDKQADRNIKDWNAGRLPFMALHPASGGHGLNLQHGGADMAWISPTWAPELWDQTLARLHRSGQPRQVVVRVCVADDTIDDTKLDRVHRKLTAQEAFERYLQKVSSRIGTVKRTKAATIHSWSKHARMGDPDTSHEAVPKNLTDQAVRILRIYGSTRRPLLDVDAYRLAGFGPTACDGQRCSDLRQHGFIERTGERAKTPSGKFGYLCRITPAGAAFLKEMVE